jgi:DNA polymerase IV
LCVAPTGEASASCHQPTLAAPETADYNQLVGRCVFHVDLDAFFVAVERLHDPTLNGKPVIVGGHRNSRGVVSAASYEARKFGVHSAMPLVHAQRLCPHAVFVPVHFGRYIDASRRFMSLLDPLAPLIEPLGLDEAFLEMTDVVRDYDDARARAIALKLSIREELGLVASVGVAPCKIVAKVASDFDKPDGLVVVHPGDEAGFLAPLAIRRLPGVGKKTEVGLADLGVATIGDLASLSEGVMERRFGRYGIALLQHARGIDPSPVEPRGEPQSMSRETTFPVDISDRGRLQSTLQAMCEELAEDLRVHKMRARSVTIKVRYEDFQTVTRQSTLKAETAEAGDLCQSACSLLTSLTAGEYRRVRLIGAKVSRLSGPERQLDMFSPESAKMRDFERAIAQVHHRFGRDSLQTLGEKARKANSGPRAT